MDSNGWEQWKNHVLSSLERIESTIKAINDRCLERPELCSRHIPDIVNRLSEVERSIVELRVRNSIFSIIASIVAGMLAILVSLLIRR